jgi:hypothetical protein
MTSDKISENIVVKDNPEIEVSIQSKSETQSQYKNENIVLRLKIEHLRKKLIDNFSNLEG